MTSYVAGYYSTSFVDGPGVRVSIYLSGCTHNCKGCYNKKAQDFKFGEQFTDEHLTRIIKDLEPSYITGISILGGEPFQNIDTLKKIIKEVRCYYGNEKDIWVWSGYRFEYLKKKEITEEIDVIVDGLFIERLKEKNLAYRGSSNQRIIDVKESLANNEIITLNFEKKEAV